MIVSCAAPIGAGSSWAGIAVPRGRAPVAAVPVRCVISSPVVAGPQALRVAGSRKAAAAVDTIRESHCRAACLDGGSARRGLLPAENSGLRLVTGPTTPPLMHLAMCDIKSPELATNHDTEPISTAQPS